MVNEKAPFNNDERMNDNPQKALFALNMYLNRFMWISTREIVTGISSCYYSDTQGGNGE